MLKAARWTVLGLLALSLLVLAFAVGYVIRGDGSSEASPDAGDSVDAQRELDFETLNQIARLLQDRYVDPDRIDRETLYEAAINGMLRTLSDSGTYYVDPGTIDTRVGLSGTFEGIGATVTEQDGQVVVVAPFEDSPAERAGIRAGDVIVAVDGESAEGWSSEEAVIRIRGPKGSTVSITVRHEDGVEETYEIERDEIMVASVTTQPPAGVLRDGSGEEITDVGYIYIREFNEQTTNEVKEILERYQDEGKSALIIDVRNNLGGLLNTTVEVADEFLDDGVILIERERDGRESSYDARDGGAATDIPVVVLQNRFSASGAEVLAAALHDNGRATIVGEKSFGKGTVNIPSSLRDGGELYVSIAHWLTPDGVQIDGVGVRPDVEIALSDEDVDERRDVQLFKALDILRGTATAPERTATTAPTATVSAGPAVTATPGG